MGEFGLSAEDYTEPEVGIWPECWDPIELFTQMSTQWRVGMNGPTGLDYNVVFHELDRMGLARDDYDALLAGLRVVERTALEEIHKS